MAINIFSLLNSVILSRALFVASELNIAEYLEKKSMTLDELTIITSTDKSSLCRLLHFLELHDVFAKDNDLVYHNTEFSKTMCADHPQSVKPFLLHDDETRWNSFGNLGYSINTGKASFDMLYGQSYFDHLKNHPELSQRFDQAMTIISAQEDAKIAELIQFNGTVVDIGGGKGQLIENIIEQHPNACGILFDLPEVVSQTEIALSIKKVPGSFFEPISINADIFILKRILHDWNDDKAIQILKNVSTAMNDGSKLYIVDGILDKAVDKKLLAAIDLALLAIFEGKERTMLEINNLLKAADLEVVKIIDINNLICAIECRKLS